MHKIGLIINPVAGIGGRVGLKGSDGEDIQRQAFEKGAVMEAENKTKIALEGLLPIKEALFFLTAPGIMGENLLQSMGFSYKAIGKAKPEKTSHEDTEESARLMKEEKPEILVFAGGDGTARNIYNAVGIDLTVMGIPAGVKIHSAVYANNPKSAGEALRLFLESRVNINVLQCEVMDIDEALFRNNRVQAKLYGYLSVPQIKNLMQHPKSGAKYQSHDIEGIAEEVIDIINKGDQDTYYIFGTGSTTFNILKHMNIEGTLLGIDVIYRNEILMKDCTEDQIFRLIEGKKVKLILTVIGGQGHVFGRGNQQLSPRVIRKIGIENIIIVSSADKIYNLPGNILLVDTGDTALDKEIAGYRQIITGWQERIVCKISD